MVILKTVKDVFTRLAIFNKVALAKHLKLMGNGRLGHTQKTGNITHAHRLTVYGKKYAGSCGITEDLEEVRKVVESFLVGHLCPLLFDQLAMYLLALAGGGILNAMLHFITSIVERLFNRCVYYIISPPICQAQIKKYQYILLQSNEKYGKMKKSFF